MTGTALYFAYGSNLTTERMADRVPRAAWVEIGKLEGYRIICNKVGLDGSAKANLQTETQDLVWGALYEMPHVDFDLLDPFEDGYVRVEVPVIRRSGPICQAVTYISDRLTEDHVPYDWYRGLIVNGAKEVGLPANYVRRLEALPSRPDPKGRTR